MKVSATYWKSECFIEFPNTDKKVEYTAWCGVFSTKLEVFRDFLKETLTNVFILLHGRSNKTLYGDVSLIPLPADYQPSVQQLPGTGTGLDKGTTGWSIMPGGTPL